MRRRNQEKNVVEKPPPAPQSQSTKKRRKTKPKTPPSPLSPELYQEITDAVKPLFAAPIKVGDKEFKEVKPPYKFTQGLRHLNINRLVRYMLKIENGVFPKPPPESPGNKVEGLEWLKTNKKDIYLLLENTSYSSSVCVLYAATLSKDPFTKQHAVRYINWHRGYELKSEEPFFRTHLTLEQLNRNGNNNISDLNKNHNVRPVLERRETAEEKGHENEDSPMANDGQHDGANGDHLGGGASGHYGGAHNGQQGGAQNGQLGGAHNGQHDGAHNGQHDGAHNAQQGGAQRNQSGGDGDDQEDGDRGDGTGNRERTLPRNSASSSDSV